LQDLGARWEILSVQIKPYAACRWMHSSLDALVALKRQVKVEDIQKIDVYTYKVAAQALSGREPPDLLAMQFSIPHVFGLALAGESLIDMRESGIANQAALDLSRKVHVHFDEGYEAMFRQNMLPSKVLITLVDGSQLEKEVLVPLGEEANPITEAEHRRKIRTLIESSPYQNVRAYAWNLIQKE
jgi:2-methylcitrate dehydratase PrpD